MKNWKNGKKKTQTVRQGTGESSGGRGGKENVTRSEEKDHEGGKTKKKERSLNQRPTKEKPESLANEEKTSIEMPFQEKDRGRERKGRKKGKKHRTEKHRKKATEYNPPWPPLRRKKKSAGFVSKKGGGNREERGWEERAKSQIKKERKGKQTFGKGKKE